MAYDAEIRVGTKVDARPLNKIEKTFDDISKRVDVSKKKLEALEAAGATKNSKVWKEAVEDFKKWNTELEKISEEQQRLQEEQNKTAQSLNYFKREIEKYKAVLSKLENNDKYFGDEEYDIAYASLKRLEAMLGVYKQSVANSTGSTNVFKQQISELTVTLAELEREGFSLGDKEYDDTYIALQNVIDAQKEYKENLHKMTARGMAEEADRVAKELEKQAEAQRRIEKAAERNLQKENARLEKEAQIEAKKQVEITEQNRLNAIHDNAVVFNQKLVDLLEKQKQITERMTLLKKAGVTAGYKEYDSLRSQLAEINKAIKSEEDISNHKKISDGFGRMNAAAKKAFAAMSGALGHVNRALGKVGSVAKGVFQKLHKGAERSNGQFSTLTANVKRFVVNILLLGQAAKAFRTMVSGAGEGIQEFAKYSKDCNAVLSDLKSSLQTMKYSLGAAFAPIIQTVVPYLTQLINVLNNAISKLAEFFAAITGRSTFYRAISQQADFAGSLEDTAEAAKKAAGALAGFDRLNVINQEEDSGSSGSGGGTGAGFEEVPVENDIKRLADKVEEILSSLFAPMKEAWDREGQFVIDSWKSALKEIWALAKDMGRDFLIVWNQEETIQMFADILHIIGDIGLVAGNLARNFREAWNENNTGLHIFENIRDILAVIIANIRKAADYTVEWSEDLNFKPLLTSFEGFTASLVPVMDNLSGVLTDFYTKVLLPLGKWTLEKGIPELLDVFTAFNKKVDWERLRANLAELWEHLEPFAETVGEGLILFIERVSNLVADFLNSETFVDFLHAIEDWMDSVEPEDVADAIEKLAKALIGLKAAVVILDAALKVSRIVTGLGRIVRSLLKFKEYVGKAVLFLKNINWTSLFSTINPGMIGEMGLTLERMLQGTFLDTSTWEGLPKKVNDAINGAIDAVMQGLGEAFVNIFDFTQTLDLFEAVGYWFEELKKDFAERDWKSIGIDILNAIGSGILGALSFVTEPIQNIFKMIQDAFSKIAQWINELLSGMNKVRSAGAGLAGIGAGAVQNIVGKSNVMQKNINIPQLATGSVIRGGNPFLAILGEQPSGQTNVEAPLSTIKQALKEGMRESGMTGGGIMELNVYLTGKQIYHEIVKQDQIVKKSTGRSGFAK